MERRFWKHWRKARPSLLTRGRLLRWPQTLPNAASISWQTHMRKSTVAFGKRRSSPHQVDSVWRAAHLRGPQNYCPICLSVFLSLPWQVNLMFLMSYWCVNRSTSEGAEALQMALHTLRMMALGGIHDHVAQVWTDYLLKYQIFEKKCFALKCWTKIHFTSDRSCNQTCTLELLFLYVETTKKNCKSYLYLVIYILVSLNDKWTAFL